MPFKTGNTVHHQHHHPIETYLLITNEHVSQGIKKDARVE